jgi:uroporphyrin-III C-methyltransferase / precorrin-2 dehydrogenase / sirohydrochlorin ferrochelatase
MSEASIPATAAEGAERAALLPIFLQLQGRKVLLVGAGLVAARKLVPLLEAGAEVLIVATSICAEITAQLGPRVQWLAQAFTPAQLDDVWLVYAATDNTQLNRQVYAEASARKLWCNVVDDAAHSSFHSPARVHRGALQIAISSGGSAPMLARHVRAQLERDFDERYSALSKLLEANHALIRATLPDQQSRREFFAELLDTPALLQTAANHPEQAQRTLLRQLTTPREQRVHPVAIIGAGPGDAGLLTLRAFRLMQQADVILTDYLVSAEVLSLARKDAERIYVGKQGNGAHTEQARIHELMLAHALSGKRVVRLKGGDPLIFGRGGEEMQALRAHGIAYQVVPGITAALACAAYAGIPLTHREHAQSVRFITAHCRQSIDSLDWRGLALERQTLAVYMGVARIATLQAQLLHYGRAPNTPCALIENGSRPEQRTVLCTLSTLGEAAQRHKVQAPCLLVIGLVAGLARELRWFGDYIDAERTSVISEETEDLAPA